MVVGDTGLKENGLERMGQTLSLIKRYIELYIIKLKSILLNYILTLMLIERTDN
jgi:hypothetical protein